MVIKRRKMIIPKPVGTTIDLTEACNLACDYCFTWSKKHKRKTISYDMATRIIDWWVPQTALNKNIQLSFWGGEPLLEWELMKKLVYYTNDLCKKINYKPFEFGGTTNGLLYTPDKVEWCVENQSLFMVSLDGIQPVHDKHRKLPSGKGSWKIIDKNLREALKIAPQQKIRSSLTDDTIEYFFESIQYFVEDLGITDLAFSPVFENKWSQKSLDILSEQFELIINYVIKKAKEGTDIILKHLNDEAHMVSKKTPQNSCGAGNGYSGWSIDGFMFPCHRFNKHGLTTFERANLPTIIARPKGDSFEYCNKNWRSEFINWKYNVPQQCMDCDIFDKSVCNGGCYAVNWDLTGSLYKQADSVCNYNKVQHEAGIKFRELAKKENIILPRSKWDGNNQQKKSCTCYNLCYNEGTQKEIIHIDRSTDMSCVCYNSSYSGEAKPQCRTVQELDAQRAAEQKVIKAAQKMMESI
jgi:uncharacterized protein